LTAPPSYKPGAKTAIETKVAANDWKGIAFDYMACLLMLAFTFEATINFLGSKLKADKWNALCGV
jgi:hypothetical protein